MNEVTPTIPGYRTAHFWLASLVTGLTALVASGAGLGSLAGGVTLAIGGLTAAGYTALRIFKKSEDPSKPAWKSTEFWLTVASVAVSTLYASGVLSSGSWADNVAGVISGLLAMLGYAVAKPANPTIP